VRHPFKTLELAQRLRHSAETTNMPEYADLMRRAAEELEAISRAPDSTRDERERLAG